MKPVGIIILLLLNVSAPPAWAKSASPVIVGNGDDGADLEGAKPIESGPIFEARAKAASRLRELGVPGIAGLGMLLPEVETSKLFLAAQDAKADLPEDQAKFHSDMNGRVYARTFARPHAATRFFPAAEKLGEDQLIALSIHEALHRSLPESVRENEAKVSAITLAITAPEASRDAINEMVAKNLPPEALMTADQIRMSRAASEQVLIATPEQEANPVPDDARVRNPSTLGFENRIFQRGKTTPAFAIDRMYVLQSFLYPFGKLKDALGFGIEGALIQQPNQAVMGPLDLSARFRLWSGRGFDFETYAEASLNTLSAAELANSPMGRDVFTAGITARKTLDFAFFEDSLAYTAPGSVDQTVANETLHYNYGSVIQATVRAGIKLWKLHVGGFAEMYLADYYRVNQDPNFAYDSGRYRIVSAGPEVSLIGGHFGATVKGRFLLNASQDVDFDSLGNIMGPGVAQGSLSGSVNYYF